jgi:outer membrane protein OmpA-like peptidoglycan-associated protein
VGAGLNWYSDDVDNDGDISFRIGVGLIANLDDTWSLRLDTRSIVAGSDTEANLIAGGGLFRTLGVKSTATPPPPIDSGPIDTDGDGLSDTDETDKHKTDPLDPDTDRDGLSDGDEVLVHKTNPLKRDSDSGGVADGHEIIEDGTNPLKKGDDARLFELKPVYANDGTTLKEEFLTELDVTGQYLSQNKDVKARIEAHVDDEKGLAGKAGKRLTQKRAKGIANTLVKKWKIKGSRIKAVGYGSSRPKAESGSSDNERVEIYVQ